MEYIRQIVILFLTISCCLLSSCTTYASVRESSSIIILGNTGELSALTQDMFVSPNTIYVLRDNFDLDNLTIKLPENCIVRFSDSGHLSNGKLVGNKTVIDCHKHTFNNVCFEGNYETTCVKLSWFDYQQNDYSQIINNLLCCFQSIEIDGTFEIESDIKMNAGSTLHGIGTLIMKDASVVCENLGRINKNREAIDGFVIEGIKFKVETPKSLKPVILIKHCYDSRIANIEIADNKNRFQNSQWTGIKVYAENKIGGCCFLNVDNVKIMNPYIGVHLYNESGFGAYNSKTAGYITACNFNNIIVDRFVYAGFEISGPKVYSNNFSNCHLSSNYASHEKKRYGLKIDNDSGNNFTNISIWADSKGHNSQFFAIDIDKGKTIHKTTITGYVEGYLTERTKKILEDNSLVNFFWQDADSQNYPKAEVKNRGHFNIK